MLVAGRHAGEDESWPVHGLWVRVEVDAEVVRCVRVWQAARRRGLTSRMDAGEASSVAARRGESITGRSCARTSAVEGGQESTEGGSIQRWTNVTAPG